MNVREWLDNHPRVAAVSAGACMVVCIGAIAAETLGNRHPVLMHSPDHYFSTDDGHTFFTASGTNIAPFDYQGATAVRAYVFNCGGHPFVGYLERYNDESRKVELSGKPVPIAVEMYGRELKKPGDPKWVSSKNPSELEPILTVKCPEGLSSAPVPVEP